MPREIRLMDLHRPCDPGQSKGRCDDARSLKRGDVWGKIPRAGRTLALQDACRPSVVGSWRVPGADEGMDLSSFRIFRSRCQSLTLANSILGARARGYRPLEAAPRNAGRNGRKSYDGRGPARRR